MTFNKDLDYKPRILNQLLNNSFGLTITDLSREINGNRNTVSKYLKILEAEGLIFKKKIGKASLFFSKKKKHIQKDLVSLFLKSFFQAIKTEIPNKEQSFRNIGRNMINTFEFPLAKSYSIEIKDINENYSSERLLKSFQKFYNFFDFFQEPVDIKIVDLQQNKAIYRFKKSEFLETSNDYIYYFYMICGATEGLFMKFFNQKIICDIEKINVSSKKNDSFVDISISIK